MSEEGLNPETSLDPDGIEVIPYDPSNVTDLGHVPVIINGESRQVHETSNFRGVVSAYLAYKSALTTFLDPLPELLEDANPLQKIHYQDVHDNFEIIDKSFAELQSRYPRLYERVCSYAKRGHQLVLVRKDLAAQSGHRSPEITRHSARNQPPAEEVAKMAYHFSMALDAVVPIAREMTPGFDINIFTR